MRVMCFCLETTQISPFLPDYEIKIVESGRTKESRCFSSNMNILSLRVLSSSMLFNGIRY